MSVFNHQDCWPAGLEQTLLPLDITIDRHSYVICWASSLLLQSQRDQGHWRGLFGWGGLRLGQRVDCDAPVIGRCVYLVSYNICWPVAVLVAGLASCNYSCSCMLANVASFGGCRSRHRRHRHPPGARRNGVACATCDAQRWIRAYLVHGNWIISPSVTF